MRKIAAWYALGVGVCLVALPFVLPAFEDEGAPGSRTRTILFVVAGVLLATGATARLMRLPGRVASFFLGLGAGGMALLAGVSFLLIAGGPAWQAGVMLGTVAGLVAVAWSVWPSGS